MVWRRIRARIRPGAVILGYHRITRNPVADPYGITVSERHFVEQMEAIRHLARPISLDRLLQNLSEDAVQPRSLVVTFDDGYRDTLEIAGQVLERLKIPATVFVTTGYLGEEFWWDRVARIVDSSPDGDDTVSNKLSELAGHRIEESTAEPLTRRLYRFLLASPIDERDRILHELETTAPVTSAHSVDRSINEAELAEWIGNSSLIEIGAHSVNHPMLAELEREDQFREILDSKVHLEAALGRTVHLFSYPNGSCSTETEKLVREAGFAGACASHGDVVSKGTNRFRLPRFWPRDEDGASFGKWLAPWMSE